MIVGVADTSFLASIDFKKILLETNNLSFAIYSPLAWFYGYRRYAVRSIRFEDRYYDRYDIDDFLERRLENIEHVDKELLFHNLKLGIETGRLFPIRNLFSRHYSRLRKVLDGNFLRYNRVVLRDLCNVLLANQLQIPLWIEKNSDEWIENFYNFQVVEKSYDIEFPLFIENPKQGLTYALFHLMASISKKEKLENIVKELESNLSNLINEAYYYKGVFLSVLEPLPIWESIELWQRYLSSVLFTIVDVHGIRKYRSQTRD